MTTNKLLWDWNRVFSEQVGYTVVCRTSEWEHLWKFLFLVCVTVMRIWCEVFDMWRSLLSIMAVEIKSVLQYRRRISLACSGKHLFHRETENDSVSKYYIYTPNKIKCTPRVHWGTVVCGLSKLGLWSASISSQILFRDTLSFYLPPSSAEVKNEWSYTSAVPICPNGMCRDDFPYIINLFVGHLWMLLWSLIVVSGD